MMTDFDVFNGDADGICALQQLRLAEPRQSVLVTGVKRDIALLERVQAGRGDRVTVLDIALEKNLNGLNRLLGRGARVRYFDHHFAGNIPEHAGLEAHIEAVPGRGTSLIVDDFLGAGFRAWAVVGTFGDNFDEAAQAAARPLGLRGSQLESLRELGIYLNYNGYGARVEDLHFSPLELFRRLHPFVDPLEFIAVESVFEALRQGFADDMARARALRAELLSDHHGLYILPPEPWARRVGGVFANELARSAPQRAHALLTPLSDGGYMVSVRAPLAARESAEAFCRRFPTGGGRQLAAGINRLADAAYEDFVTRFRAAFGGSPSER